MFHFYSTSHEARPRLLTTGGQLQDRLILVIQRQPINTHLGQSTIFCSGNSSTGLGIEEIKITVTECALIDFLLTITVATRHGSCIESTSVLGATVCAHSVVRKEY